MGRKRRRSDSEGGLMRAPKSWLIRLHPEDVLYQERVKVVRKNPRTGEVTIKAKGGKKLWVYRNGKWQAKDTVTINIRNLRSFRTEDGVYLKERMRR